MKILKLFVIGGPILDIVEIQIGHLIHNVLLLADAFLHIRVILGIGLDGNLGQIAVMSSDVPDSSAAQAQIRDISSTVWDSLQ